MGSLANHMPLLMFTPWNFVALWHYLDWPSSSSIECWSRNFAFSFSITRCLIAGVQVLINIMPKMLNHFNQYQEEVKRTRMTIFGEIVTCAWRPIKSPHRLANKTNHLLLLPNAFSVILTSHVSIYTSSVLLYPRNNNPVTHNGRHPRHLSRKGVQSDIQIASIINLDRQRRQK